MKKHLLLILFALFMSAAFAQDTITGWTFPVNSGADSLNANLGTAQNQGYDLRFQWVLTATTDSTLNTVYFDDGPTTYCAAASGWDNGADVKFWSIKFKAADYTSFKVSSKQRSSSDNKGPEDFKLQWRLSSGTFEDIPGGTVTVGDDWIMGVVTDLPVPITGQGSSSVYIRWIMTSNNGVGDGEVVPNGYSLIDDILVTGISTLGTHDILYTNRLNVSPNPNHGKFTVKSTGPVAEMSIFNVSGNVVRTVAKPSATEQFDLQGLAKGVYFLKVKFEDSDAVSTSKLVIE